MVVKIINDPYSIALQTLIRDKKATNAELKESLIKLGSKIGIDIVSENLLSESEIVTPLDRNFNGFKFSNTTNLIYSTKDDFKYFANGIQEIIPNSQQGFLDFQGVRGEQALTQPIRAASHPKLKPGTVIDNVIIAKAVLATGCTAISLTRNIISKYQPKNIIVASAFYSQNGVQELLSEFPLIKFIYTVGKPDTLNSDGLLIPGVGNLDNRLSS